MTRVADITEAQHGVFDVAIIGGGIHGASVARHAALAGYRVLLLEAKDFAFGTSSRSSKMLHGGIRYLETGDFRLVHEALIERAILLHSAPHLARPQEFLFPIIEGQTRPAWQVRVGLAVYDVLARGISGKSPFANHRALSASSKEAHALDEMGLKCKKVFAYSDGQMDDTRIVIENIVDANSLGALTLNYASVAEITSLNAEWHIAWQCKLTGERYQSQARFLVNTSGPWLPTIDQKIAPWKTTWPAPLLSRGTHLLFDIPWTLPGTILPTGVKGRYYFVWPFFSPFHQGTLVGTTDDEIADNEDNPQPTGSDTKELLGYLRRDLPAVGFSESKIFHSFCGVRLLARRTTKKSSDVSRADYFLNREGYVGLLGGKFTTSRLTAEKMCSAIDRHFGKRRTRNVDTKTRILPGGSSFSVETTIAALQNSSTLRSYQNISPQYSVAALARRAVERFGSRSLKLVELQSNVPNIELPNTLCVLPEEILLCAREEHGHSVEDICFRRLGLQYVPGNKETFIAYVTRLLELSR